MQSEIYERAAKSTPAMTKGMSNKQVVTRKGKRSTALLSIGLETLLLKGTRFTKEAIPVLLPAVRTAVVIIGSSGTQPMVSLMELASCRRTDERLDGIWKPACP